MEVEVKVEVELGVNVGFDATGEAELIREVEEVSTLGTSGEILEKPFVKPTKPFKLDSAEPDDEAISFDLSGLEATKERKRSGEPLFKRLGILVRLFPLGIEAISG